MINLYNKTVMLNVKTLLTFFALYDIIINNIVISATDGKCEKTQWKQKSISG